MFSRAQRWLLLASFALLVILRLPRTWIHGRFLDEEATVFLAYAWHRPWQEALFRPFAGYWNLGADGTTVAAVELIKNGVLPLERAPYFTMIVALGVQLLPAVLILTGRATWLNGRLAVIAALLTIVLAPATEEVFLNVIHIQFHLALCAALILALDVPRGQVAGFGYAVLLFLAPLCGPGPIVILPLFALRALIDRDRARLWQLASFAIGAAAQLFLFYGVSPLRGHLFDVGTIAATMFVRLIALPVLNFDGASQIGAAIDHSQVTGGSGWWWAAGVALLCFGALIVAAVRRRDAALWLILSALTIAATSFGFGMVIVVRDSLFAPSNGERYQFLPLVLIGFALIALAMRGSRARLVYALLCVLMLVTGAFRYPTPLRDFADGPSWPREVAAWRRDHEHPLAVWPQPWTADLSDRNQSCSPSFGSQPQPAQPRYCEGGWAAGFFHDRQAGVGEPIVQRAGAP